MPSKQTKLILPHPIIFILLLILNPTSGQWYNPWNNNNQVNQNNQQINSNQDSNSNSNRPFDSYNRNTFGNDPRRNSNPTNNNQNVNYQNNQNNNPSWNSGSRPDLVNRFPVNPIKSIISPNQRFFLSDSRCSSDLLNLNPEEHVHVNTRYGKVTGRLSFLCDIPGTPERDRPVITYPSNPVNPSSNPYTSSSSFIPPSPNLIGGGGIPRARVRANVTCFLGIPYARAPTRENGLRFKSPRDPDHWGSLDATRFGPACPQVVSNPNNPNFQNFDQNKNNQNLNQNPNNQGSPVPPLNIHEDCLYANIYSPYVTHAVHSPFPVMINIHGGNFESGSGNEFPGHMLSASQQVVVVTFNYRLGLLGFFATGDNSSAGNYGLQDMAHMIKFVKENIRAFNGDPESITLFGGGAGAAAAGLLALSPTTRHSVKRVIGYSGSPTAPWAMHSSHALIRNNSIVAGFKYGCRTHHSLKLVQCLTSRSFSDLCQEDVIPEVGWLPWAPVPDFATRLAPFSVLPFKDGQEGIRSRAGSFPPDFAYLTGVTRDEASGLLMDDAEMIKKGFQVDSSMFEDKISSFVRIMNATLNPDAFKGALRFLYSPPTDSNNETLIRDGLVKMLSDAWFVSGVDSLTKSLLKSNVKHVYMYVLNYTIQGLDWPEWRSVPHQVESLLAAGAPFMDPAFFPLSRQNVHLVNNLPFARWTEADRNMSQFFMESWANFARYGNPTPRAAFNTILWKPMSHQTLEYLSVNTTNYTSIMHRDYRQKYSQFWNEYLPALSMSVPPTWPPTYEPMEVELRVYRAATWAVTSALVILCFLTLLCSCLYCRAKRDRWGDAAIDDYLPNIEETLSSKYSAPSTRANSESSLRSLSRSRDRVDFTQMKPLNQNTRDKMQGHVVRELVGAKFAASGKKTEREPLTNGQTQNQSMSQGQERSASRASKLSSSRDAMSMSSRTSLDHDVTQSSTQNQSRMTHHSGSVVKSMKGSPRLRSKNGHHNQQPAGVAPITKFTYSAYR